MENQDEDEWVSSAEQEAQGNAEAARERAEQWQHMLNGIPSAPQSDHGCKLANYLARQERRRNATLCSGLRVPEQEG